MPALFLIVARKEILDHARDGRALISAAFYALMGPIVVLMVSVATGFSKDGAAMLLSMMSVFALVATFIGGMNVAMESIAGERERRSLLPLLLNPIETLEVIIGKWLAIGFYAVCGLAVNLLGCSAVLAIARLPMPRTFAVVVFGLVPLALLAAAVELLISTYCRNVKEAHTYLSLVVFVPMGVGMFLVFSPHVLGTWWFLFPIAGQQSLLSLSMRGNPISAAAPIVLGLVTIALGAVALIGAARLLKKDDVVYGS